MTNDDLLRLQDVLQQLNRLRAIMDSVQEMAMPMVGISSLQTDITWLDAFIARGWHERNQEPDPGVAKGKMRDDLDNLLDALEPFVVAGHAIDTFATQHLGLQLKEMPAMKIAVGGPKAQVFVQASELACAAQVFDNLRGKYE